MKHIIFKTHDTQDILFEGSFRSEKDALEAAIQDNACLENINLDGLNLRNITLDETTLSGASFVGTNLQGANLSDTKMTSCRFINTDLTSACLAESQMTDCVFDHAEFGNTLIENCVFYRCEFVGASSFNLNFMTTKSMDNCFYMSGIGNHDNTRVHMTKPPIVISGLSRASIAILDDHVFCGASLFKRSDISCFNIK
jgi:hypothetical protein